MIQYHNIISYSTGTVPVSTIPYILYLLVAQEEGTNVVKKHLVSEFGASIIIGALVDLTIKINQISTAA
jgi:hypothetical protein